MSDLLRHTFKFGDQCVRFVGSSANPWYRWMDIALCLGCRSPEETIRDHLDVRASSKRILKIDEDNLDPTYISGHAVNTLTHSCKCKDHEDFLRWMLSTVECTIVQMEISYLQNLVNNLLAGIKQQVENNDTIKRDKWSGYGTSCTFPQALSRICDRLDELPSSNLSHQYKYEELLDISKYLEYEAKVNTFEEYEREYFNLKDMTEYYQREKWIAMDEQDEKESTIADTHMLHE